MNAFHSRPIPAAWLITMSSMAVLTAVVLVGLSGCNTTEGAGKDIKAAGEAIEDTARDAKD